VPKKLYNTIYFLEKMLYNIISEQKTFAKLIVARRKGSQRMKNLNMHAYHYGFEGYEGFGFLMRSDHQD